MCPASSTGNRHAGTAQARRVGQVMTLAGKSVLAWLVILVLAVANGALREAFLVPHLGKHYGLLLSGFLLSVFIFLTAFLTLPWLRANTPRQLIGIGVGWLALTLAFELAFGRVQGKPWPVIFEAYMFKDGNLWSVVLLATLTAPYITAKLRGMV